MKIAALGDIHGNHYALEACLEQIEKLHIQTIAFLGDYITDCPCPEKTIALLRQAQERYQTYFVRGNREDYMLSHHDDPNDGWTYGSRYGSLLYTYERLTEEDLAWFRSMPESMQVQIDGVESFEICNGSMKTNRYLLLPGSSEWETTPESMKTDLLLCAHSHQSFIHEVHGKWIVNGGSVGVNVQDRTDADLAVIEYSKDRWIPQLIRVPYDTDSAIREFYESGFVDKANVWARAVMGILKTGRHYAMECLQTVNRMKAETNTDQDEEYLWESVARSFGI